LFGAVLRRFTVSAQTLWRFLLLLEMKMPTARALREAAPAYSVQSGYRWRKVLLTSQSRLRTQLCRIRPPPTSASHEPLSQLTAHFLSAFPLSSCPVAEFQVRFQQPFFG
jgi:hypothetical protein